MKDPDDFEIFLVAQPGLEEALCAEAAERQFPAPRAVPGGVKLRGHWPDVWRANLVLRGATRVLARIDSFQVETLDKLARRARRVPWAEVLRADVPVSIEVSCSRSRLYHTGAVAERIADAMQHKHGVRTADAAPVSIFVRLDNNICTISVDSSGELLHKRGHKAGIHRAPIRETMAALFLRQCGYDGREPVLDPMCGAGTFVIEAAEMAAGLAAGRMRPFAFEQLATFDATAWQQMRAAQPPDTAPAIRFYGSDRDEAAITMSRANAESAGVAAFCDFKHHAVSDLVRPDGPPGLVIVNPPYGDRIGDKERLTALYAALGRTLMTRFAGWRVGLVTSEKPLAYATALPFLPPAAPVSHGGLRVTLFRTAPLI
jgi:putative N6-adenine-specific DNA methylase